MSTDNPNSRPPTRGERRVGVSFNPSGDVNVARVKEATAALVDDALNQMDATQDPERKRRFAEAATNYETACMYLVKGYAAP